MKVPTKDVIQADRIETLKLALGAIAAGAQTDAAIAKALGDYDPRQGRYYRRAAEILGLAQRLTSNESTLTKLGELYSQSDETQKMSLLLGRILSNVVFVRLLSFLESRPGERATRPEIADFLASVAELGSPAMATRRASSYISWLRHFGILEELDGEVHLLGLNRQVSMIEVSQNTEPLLPKNPSLEVYEAQVIRTQRASKSIAYFVDQAKHERAVNSHEQLVELVAARLTDLGAIPRRNKYVDLTARVNEEDYLFEMKSNHDRNTHAQIRRGVSQLYEYRYIQGMPSAKLVLVLEAPIPSTRTWLEKYLLQDRGILLLWDGNGTLNCSREARAQIPFISHP